jgi:hypothetical protein
MCDRVMRHDRGVVLSSKVQLSLTCTFSACLSSLQMFWDSPIFIVVGQETKSKAMVLELDVL